MHKCMGMICWQMKGQVGGQNQAFGDPAVYGISVVLVPLGKEDINGHVKYGKLLRIVMHKVREIRAPNDDTRRLRKNELAM